MWWCLSKSLPSSCLKSFLGYSKFSNRIGFSVVCPEKERVAMLCTAKSLAKVDSARWKKLTGAKDTVLLVLKE